MTLEFNEGTINFAIFLEEKEEFRIAETLKFQSIAANSVLWKVVQISSGINVKPKAKGYALGGQENF